MTICCHEAHDITNHLLASTPNRSYMEVHGLALDRFLKHPAIEEGFSKAPERPGHGIQLAYAALAPFRIT